MKRYVSFFAIPLLGVALLAGGCKGKPANDEASIKKTLEEKGTIDVMDQVSKAPEYKPPADAHLTDQQVKMYIDVRQREQKIREVAFKNLKAKDDKVKQEKRDMGLFEAMKAIGDVADVATADLRAAQELGHNPKEYQWVKERVMEAQMLEVSKSLNQQMAKSQESLVKMLEEQKKLATDAAQRAEMDKQIEEIKKSAAEAVADSSPAKEYNAALLARYKDELDKLKAEDERINQSMSSGSQESGK